MKIKIECGSGLTRSFLRILQGYVLKDDRRTPAFGVDGVDDQLYGHFRLQVRQVEVRGFRCREVHSRGSRPADVDLQQEDLGEAAVGTRMAPDHHGARSFVANRAVPHGVRFACEPEIISNISNLGFLQ